MSRTPPRLKAFLQPKPLSKINLRTAYAEIRRPTSPAPGATIGALSFGRALDATERSDTDFFVDDSSPVLEIADALSDVLRRGGGDYADILRNLENNDPAEISVALDRIRDIISPDSSSPEAVVRAVSLTGELLAHVRPDTGLDEKMACHILTHAALEAYYLRGATAAAKRELDFFRDLIRLATGATVDFIQPEKKLEIGLDVWESWQGLVALDDCFGLRIIGPEMAKRGAHAFAGLAYAGDVLIRANASHVDRPALAESLEALERFASENGRKEAYRLTEFQLEPLEEDRLPVVTAESWDVESEDTLPDVRPLLPLPIDMRNAVTATPAEREELARVARRKPRAPAAIIEDMLSVVERYDVLMNGDDNSLVFEVAPMLQRSLRVLYGELELFHPATEAMIYTPASAAAQPNRDVHALRVLIARASDLDRRFTQLGDALVSGGLDLGFATDDVTAPAGSILPPQRREPDPAARSRAEALLVVLKARGLSLSESERIRVLACSEVQVLDRWLTRAATAQRIEEVFAGGGLR